MGILLLMQVGVAIVIAENLGLESGKSLTDLHHPVRAHRIPQLREIGFQSLAADKVELSTPGLPQLPGSGLALVRVTARPHQVNHLHLLSAHLLDEISKERMQHRHLDLSPHHRGEGSEKSGNQAPGGHGSELTPAGR